MLPQETMPLARGEGVWFAKSDCAGLIRRLLILLVDTCVVWGIAALAMATSELAFEATAYEVWLVGWWALLGGAFVYLALLKPTRLKTLGYRLFDVRIVTLRGERPSLLRMTCRLLLWVFGPFNQILDWLWLGGDPARQSLRDKVAGTLVVRQHAAPSGRGPIAVAFYDLFTLNIPFLEVKRSAQRVAAESVYPASAGTAPHQPRREPRTWPQTAAAGVYALLAAGGFVSLIGGSWQPLWERPLPTVVVDGGQVLYGGAATESMALELADILTELGYFDEERPGYAYLAVTGETAEITFFAPEYAWNERQVIDYYEALAAAIAERWLSPSIEVMLRTPDWQQVKHIEIR